MKCCVCEKELKVTPGIPSRQWFGKYRGDELLTAICIECIHTSGNEDWWKGDNYEKTDGKKRKPDTSGT